LFKRLTVIISLLVVLITTTSFVLNYFTGITGYTGSPGETTCTSCHFQSASSGSVSISASPSIVANKYVPGQTYTITITLKHQTLIEFGFGCEIVNGTTAAAVDAGWIYLILNQGTTSGNNPGNGRKNVMHAVPSAGTGIGPFTRTFKFQWIAPNSGPAIIYVSGIAVNGDNSTSGDYTKTISWSLTPATATSIISVDKEFFNLSIYPNPASSEITLNYGVLNDGSIKAILYNLQGKEISVLFNSYQSAGISSKTILLPNDISAGVYLIKLSFNGKDVSEKMIVKH